MNFVEPAGRVDRSATISRALNHDLKRRGAKYARGTV